MPTITKPRLREIHLTDVLPPRHGRCFITMSVGQAWDPILDCAYRSGWVVLELDDDEQPVRAFQQQAPGVN
jgi:hypothetical protein